MITYFKCIIFYKKTNGFYRFRIAHIYTPQKYCILSSVVEDGVVRQTPNYFSVNANSQLSFFVVTLHEKQ